jgi:hypothetical protein
MERNGKRSLPVQDGSKAGELSQRRVHSVKGIDLPAPLSHDVMSDPADLAHHGAVVEDPDVWPAFFHEAGHTGPVLRCGSSTPSAAGSSCATADAGTTCTWT